MRRTRNATAGILLSLIGLSCADGTGPDSGLTFPSAPQGVVASNSSVLRGADASAHDGITYVSASPGTFEGATNIRIRNLTTNGNAIVAAVSNGGFDPIEIPAQGGDELALEISGSSGTSVVSIKVPPRRPPRIVRTSPSKGGIDVALNVHIEIVFSEPVVKESISGAVRLFSLTDAVPGRVAVADDGLSAVFTPDGNLDALTTYSLAINKNLTDLDGDQLEEPEIIEFKTRRWAPSNGFTWDEQTGFRIIEPSLPATSLLITAMNDRGDVVGATNYSEQVEAYRAFMYSRDEVYTELGSLAGPQGLSIATSISDDREVRGMSEGPATVYNTGMNIQLNDGFSWTSAGGMRASDVVRAPADLKPVGDGGRLQLPASTSCMQLSGYSEAGYAIGYAGNPVAATGQVAAHCAPSYAVMWLPDGSQVQIDECGLSQWCATTLSDVNNRGEVVGYRERDARGFKWSSAAGVVLVPLANSALYTINDNGDAAGSVGEGVVANPIVVTASGAVRKIELPAGAIYGYAVTINRNGQIAGNFH